MRWADNASMTGFRPLSKTVSSEMMIASASARTLPFGLQNAVCTVAPTGAFWKSAVVWPCRKCLASDPSSCKIHSLGVPYGSGRGGEEVATFFYTCCVKPYTTRFVGEFRPTIWTSERSGTERGGQAVEVFSSWICCYRRSLRADLLSWRRHYVASIANCCTRVIRTFWNGSWGELG